MNTTQPTPHSDKELDEILTEYGKRDQFLEPMARQTAKTALLQWADRRAEKLVVEATMPKLDLNAYENQLSSQVSDIDAFNLFIKKWCPHAAHLLDSDDNDGQYMRDRITALTATKEEGK